MHLEEIPEEEYSQFIKMKFNSGSISIDDGAVKDILTMTRQHTYYVQYLCNKLYSSGNKSISTETVKQVYFDILKENEIYYSEYRDLLTKQQWNLLIALANEDGISKVSASAFIKSASGLIFSGNSSNSPGCTHTESTGVLTASGSPLRSVITPRVDAIVTSRKKRAFPCPCRKSVSMTCKFTARAINATEHNINISSRA